MDDLRTYSDGWLILSGFGLPVAHVGCVLERSADVYVPGVPVIRLCDDGVPNDERIVIGFSSDRLMARLVDDETVFRAMSTPNACQSCKRAWERAQQLLPDDGADLLGTPSLLDLLQAQGVAA